jgi:branched-chain amino acid transport system substrate-binding protein
MLVGLRRLVAGILLGPIAGAAAVRAVTLGLVAPPAESDATSLLRGVQLAVADENEVAGAPVTLQLRRETGQWGSAGNDAASLISDGHVDAIITPSDGAASHLILQVSGRTRVPVASLCPDSSVTDAGVPWIVRAVPRTDCEAEALFAATRRSDAPQIHWWALVPAGRPGRAVRRDLETAAHLTATRLDRFSEGSDPKTDFALLVHSIAAAAPGGVLLWLPPTQAGTIAEALRAAGYGGWLAGPSPLNSPAFVAAAGAAATGALVTGFREDPGVRARRNQFESEYRQRYEAEPDFSAAAAYDGARVLIETLRRAGDADGYRQFPLSLPTTGVTGVLRFDKSGNRTDSLQVLTCQEGLFIPLSPSEPQP